MLHGCTQSIDEFAQGTRMNVLADRYGFAVVYPEQSEARALAPLLALVRRGRERAAARRRAQWRRSSIR